MSEAPGQTTTPLTSVCVPSNQSPASSVPMPSAPASAGCPRRGVSMEGRLPPAPLFKPQITSPTHPTTFQTLAQCPYLSLL